ncbi:LysR family transcriptional regulator [Pseudoduganella umbonata]|uniref:DNA-binding transcriptional LysR family regulator n=1 Tax=Pseudoduganella umbonata TaxID=864828 RepID=A0A4P8HPN8_9BURK|nr:LysR family transcriptional regulator [Pseudoduganella umbonata]MBB3220827.1 DNA-binding transcriptional LysR family regulator [Pseudoduganella umbonata]QCP11707.1 LysR family transcriptional regulator [Pseudoduganella umbonata]
MTLQQLRDFVAVIEHGGFRAASRALRVSQAALTKSVLKLEAAHGVELVLRMQSGVLLTEPGRQLLSYARAILRDVEDAMAMLDAKRLAERMTVVVGASLDPALTLVPRVAEDFKRRNQQANVHIQQGAPGDLVDMLREGRLDLVVSELHDGLNTGNLCIEPIYREALYIASRAGPGASDVDDVADGAALAGRPWLVLGETNSARQPQDALREIFGRWGWRMPATVYSSSSLIAALDQIAGTETCCLLPERVFSHPIAARRIRKMAVAGQPVAEREVAIITKGSRHPHGGVAEFVSMTKSLARIRDLAFA